MKNLIERAAYQNSGEEILASDLGLPAGDDRVGGSGSFQEKLDAYAHRLIAEAMRRANGNRAQAACDPGLSYHQFRYYLNKIHSGRFPALAR